MLSTNYTKDLLNLQEVNVIKIQHLESETLIYTQLPVKPHICPCCSNSTSYIHDYRIRKIKDISAYGKMLPLFIIIEDMYASIAEKDSLKTILSHPDIIGLLQD